MRPCLPLALLLATFAHRALALPRIPNHWSDPYSLRPNPLYPYYRPRSQTARSPGNISTHDPRFLKDSNVPPSRTRRFTKKVRAAAPHRLQPRPRPRPRPRQDASTPSERYLDTRPTPEPTGAPSLRTTVHITNDKDFALLLPKTPGGMSESVYLVTRCPPRSNDPFYFYLFIRTRIRRGNGRDSVLCSWGFWRSLRG